MTSVKAFGILVDQGWGGGPQSVPIAEIADIARNPTPEKPKAGFPGTPVIAGIGRSKPHH
jgi:hypothetical protein